MCRRVIGYAPDSWEKRSNNRETVSLWFATSEPGQPAIIVVV